MTSGKTGKACVLIPKTAPMGVSCGTGSLLLIHSYWGEIDLILTSAFALLKFTLPAKIRVSALTSVVKTGAGFSFTVPVNAMGNESINSVCTK